MLLPKLNVALLFSTIKISWRYCTIIDGNWTEYKKLGCFLYFCTNFKKANIDINMQYIFNQKTFLQNIHPLSMYIVQENFAIHLSVCSIYWNFRLNIIHFKVIHTSVKHSLPQHVHSNSLYIHGIAFDNFHSCILKENPARAWNNTQRFSKNTTLSRLESFDLSINKHFDKHCFQNKNAEIKSG